MLLVLGERGPDKRKEKSKKRKEVLVEQKPRTEEENTSR